MYKDATFLAFLDVSEHSDFVPDELLMCLHTVENKVMGYRDVVFVNEKKGVVALLGDMSVVSRADSYFTNMKLPWEKSAPAELTFSVGLLESSVITRSNPIALVKTGSFGYGFQSICLTYNSLLNMMAVGLDNGNVHVYSFEEGRFDKIKEEFSLKVHSKRVMALAFDGLKAALFTVSEDGYMQTVDPIRRKVLGCSLTSVLDHQQQAVPNAL